MAPSGSLGPRPVDPAAMPPHLFPSQELITHLHALLGLRGRLSAGGGGGCGLSQKTLPADTALSAVLGLELGALPTDDLQDKGTCDPTYCQRPSRDFRVRGEVKVCPESNPRAEPG